MLSSQVQVYPWLVRYNVQVYPGLSVAKSMFPWIWSPAKSTCPMDLDAAKSTWPPAKSRCSLDLAHCQVLILWRWPACQVHMFLNCQVHVSLGLARLQVQVPWTRLSAKSTCSFTIRSMCPLDLPNPKVQVPWTRKVQLSWTWPLSCPRVVVPACMMDRRYFELGPLKKK